jgi:hypothetical protein
VTTFVESAEAYAGEPVRFPPLAVVDLAAAAAAVASGYRNQVISRVNTSCLRLAVFDGDYPWHHHPRSDELFLVVEGTLLIDLADGRTVGRGAVRSRRAGPSHLHVGRTVNLCFEDLAADTVFVDASR